MPALPLCSRRYKLSEVDVEAAEAAGRKKMQEDIAALELATAANLTSPQKPIHIESRKIIPDFIATDCDLEVKELPILLGASDFCIFKVK
jgi:hypothetical protein